VTEVKNTGISKSAMRRRVIFASTIGNAFEWFDFAIYLTFASVISKLFFPADNPRSSLLLALATFGLAFAMRPLSGVLFGIYADRVGRKKALSLLIVMMAVGTGMIGVLPTYAAIGIAAPILMVVARLIQGFSVGGEFATATAMLVEFSPPERRGYYGSFQMVSQSVAFTAGAIVAYLISTYLPPAAFESWGWRLPFLFGILVGPLGFYLRARVDESPEFEQLRARRGQVVGTPLSEVFANYRRELLIAFSVVVVGTVSNYIMVLYVPVFAVRELKLSLADAQLSAAISAGLLLLLCPLAGHLSDRFGRRMIMLPAIVAYCVVAYVMTARLLAVPSAAALIEAQALACVCMAFLWGPTPALMNEIFPVQVRSTGVSVMYNLAVMLFGGLAPMVVTWLISVTNDKMSPIYYVLASGVIGIVGLLALREKWLTAQAREVEA
jgi:MFS family permease